MFKKKMGKGGLKISRQKSDVFKYKFEVISIFLFALFVILSLSMFSYNPTDNSWFYVTSQEKEIINWCGAFGANFSALLFYFLGSVAYIFVLAIPFFSYFLFKTKKFRENLDRVYSFFLLIFSVAALFNTYNIDFTKSYPGGAIGSTLFKLTKYPFGVVGSKVFYFALVLVCSIIIFRVSILEIANKFFVLLAKGLKVTLKKTGELVVLCLKSVWNEVKSFFSFKTLIQKESEDETFFWQPIESKVRKIDIKELEFEVKNVDLEKNRFCDKVIYTKTYTKKIGKENVLFLPNSILCKNLFATDFAKKFAEIKAKELKEKALLDDLVSKIDYNLPDLKLFEVSSQADQEIRKNVEEEAAQRAKKLEEKLGYFGIKGKVTAIRPGPVITLFEYSPEVDSKISKIVALEDDLALALTALSIRIVAPIPGRNVVGFEISNKTRQKVFLSDLLLSDSFKKFSGKLPMTFGVDIIGNPVVQDLVGMPHLLVAGSTGSGKSVGLNTMLVSLLCKFRPDQLKLILIDPKRLEFAPYKDIPHLLFPIVTNPRQAAPVLKWLVQEMEKRYDKMAQVGVRNISEYQQLSKTNKEHEQMPFIVLMIDELADLMMVAGKDVEMQIARIAQMARAAGIHMIVATQRPSVDVVTGLIKVNFPSRVAFRVSSKIDSRTIVDCQGAEKLLGKGDMLYMSSGSSDLQRVHGAYVSVKEVEKLTSFLRSQAEPEYLDLNETLEKMNKAEVEQVNDAIYPEVLDFLKSIDEISISGLQRKYRIGFNRSARIIERLELDGFVAPAQGSKPRKVLKGHL